MHISYTMYVYLVNQDKFERGKVLHIRNVCYKFISLLILTAHTDLAMATASYMYSCVCKPCNRLLYSISNSVCQW